MKIKFLVVFIPCCLFFIILLLSCTSENDNKSLCDEFTSADSTCFCNEHPDNQRCNFVSFTIPAFTESISPHGFWKFDLDETDEEWEQRANFPGTDYGLTGSTNGIGYASSYASDKFWKYDPEGNEWTPLADL